jgi:hypothetical protein
MTITQASHMAYDLYTKLEPNGRQAASAAALALLLKLMGVNQ